MTDLARLTLQGQHNIDNAVRGWRAGCPTDEIALLNRVTEQMLSTRYCNIGLFSTVIVSLDLYVLHRKGHRQTDLYGSDLAVTVNIGELSRRKTAFFQFKKSALFKLKLEKKQLDQAAVWHEILQRSWVLAADEANSETRIEAVESLITSIGGSQSKTFSSNAWSHSLAWIRRWLNCEIGPDSSPNTTLGVEWLLAQFVVGDHPTYDWLNAGDDRPRAMDVLAGLPRRYSPARAWLVIDVAAPVA